MYWDPRIHDDNPPRFYDPLPSGPFKGKAPKREDVISMKKQYYTEIGYDEYGIPREEVLDRLGIPDAKRAIMRIRERLKI